MKKIIYFICIILTLLVLLTLFFPQNSYTEEIKNNNESNVYGKNEENSNVENVLVDNEIIIEHQNIVENAVEETNNETSADVNTIEPEIIEDNLLQNQSVEAGNIKLEEGIYIIRSVLPGNRAVGIDAGSTDNGANVNLWDYLQVGQQKFRIKMDAEGYYEIQNIRSNKLLDVVKSIQGIGMNVNQWSNNGGTDNQKWIIENGSEGYKIKSKLNGWYLNLENGIGANGENINIEVGADVKTQEFLIERIDEKGSETVFSGTTNKVITKLSGRAVGVDGGRMDNGASINLWDYIRVNQQRFKFIYNDAGYYTIVNIKSGKLLDVVGSGSESGTLVNQWEDNGGYDNQKWIVKDVGNGYCNIISKLNGLYLTIRGNGANCDLLCVENPTGRENQKFQITESGIPKGEKTVEEGTYKIVLVNEPNQSLTVDGGKTENGVNVHIWEYINSPQQQFNLVYDGEGFYEIIPVHSGKRIDVVGIGNESNVDQWINNGGNDNQRWVIRKSKAGNYNIISKRDSLYLDAYQSRTANGTNIQVYEQSGGNGQEFRLEKIENKSEKTVMDGIYQIAPQANENIVIEASESNTDNNGRVQIWQNFNVKAQKFNIEYLNGYYRISFCHSEKCLTIKNENINSGTEVIQYEWKEGNNQKWIIRDNGDGSIGIVPLSNYSLTLDIYGPIANGSIMKLYYNEKNIKQRFVLMKTGIGVNIDSNKYPGVLEAVEQLTNSHPNWQFEILYTGIDFYTAVQGEYEYANRTANLVDTNVYKGDWIAPNPYVSGNWASASYNGIAYFMDPRNFLNDVDVFQFVDLSDYYNSGATLESIQYQVNGTFLNNFAEDVRLSCEHQNVNPYYIIARLFQEQGRYGGDTIYMDGGDGKIYFNPFNIGAQVGNDVATALAKAKEQGWDSMQKGIEGGIKFIRKGYLDAHQNTLYLNKFDVNPNSPGEFYTHQYMQNLSAAYSEARIFRGAYVDTGTIDNTIKFIVPVYENMSNIPAAKPTGQETNENLPTETDHRPIYVQVSVIGSLLLRSGPGQQYTDIGRLQNGTVLISMVRYANGWQKVFTETGIVGYCSGNYLKYIKDLTNCNERVTITTNSTVNVRNGPSANNSITTVLASFENGTKGTRILKNTYYYDGYWWDLVIFDDGTKGFVASNYLKTI